MFFLLNNHYDKWWYVWIHQMIGDLQYMHYIASMCHQLTTPFRKEVFWFSDDQWKRKTSKTLKQFFPSFPPSKKEKTKQQLQGVAKPHRSIGPAAVVSHPGDYWFLLHLCRYRCTSTRSSTASLGPPRMSGCCFSGEFLYDCICLAV